MFADRAEGQTGLLYGECRGDSLLGQGSLDFTVETELVSSCIDLEVFLEILPQWLFAFSIAGGVVRQFSDSGPYRL